MSKKKWRKQKKAKQKKYPTEGQKCDRHHICYQKRSWKGGFKSKLRDHWYCQVFIPKNTLHKMIHQNVPYVPVPRDSNAREALRQLQNLESYCAIGPNDPLEKRLRILISLFDYIEQPTADGFRAQLDVVHDFYYK